MAARILVVGSANTDLVCRVRNLPGPGETVLGHDFLTAAGGKGANQAVAAARLGGQVTFLARLGSDDFGDRAVAGYLAEGIDVSHLVRDPERPSGVALILVSADGENQIAVAPGANSALSTNDLLAAKPAFESAGLVLLQLEIPLKTVLAAARLARNAGALVVLDPAPAPAEPLPPELLAMVSILTPNETELAQLGGDPAALLALGPKAVVVTCGAAGATVVTAEGERTIPAPRITPADTTAAGDAFNGALAVYLDEGCGLDLAVQYACTAGALAATREGAQPSLPSREAVERMAGGSGSSAGGRKW